MRTQRWLRPGLVLLGFLLLAPQELWASEGGGWGQVFWQFVSFLLLIVLLARLLKKPARSFMEKRSEEVHALLKQAEAKEQESQSRYAEWEGKVQSLGQEVSQLHRRITEEGEAERQRIVERALEEGKRIQDQAKTIAEQEIKKARVALKKEMADLSVELAERLLKEATRPEDQERLVKEYIGKVRELQ